MATRGCGCKKGRHILIITPSGDRVDYTNRKRWYSVIMKGVPFHRCVHRMAWTRTRRQDSGKLCFLLLR